MKKKVDNIVAAYRLISNAKLGRMEDSEKFALIKAAHQLKKVGAEIDDFMRDAQDRLRPDDFDKIAIKIQSKDKLTIEEAVKANKYNQDIANCLKDELNKEMELTFEPLSEEAIGKFIASNDFSVDDILIISDVIGE